MLANSIYQISKESKEHGQLDKSFIISLSFQHVKYGDSLGCVKARLLIF